jgi:hypothetical protein
VGVSLLAILHQVVGLVLVIFYSEFASLSCPRWRFSQVHSDEVYPGLLLKSRAFQAVCAV